MALSEDAEFAQRICSVVSHAYLSLGLGVGLELGLFGAMSSLDKPATSGEIAAMAKCKERPVREWLHQMAVGEVMEVDQTGRLYFLPPQRLAAILGFHGIFASFLPYLVQSHAKVLSVFRQDGPPGLDEEDSRAFMDYFQLTRPLTFEGFIPSAFGLVDGLSDKLNSGLNVCDVGTSKGHLAHWLAARYPACQVTGIDVDEAALAEAAATAAQRELANLTFSAGDVQALPADWSGRFDLVIMLYVLHDIPQSTKAVEEARRVLKDGGTFFVVEVFSNDNPKENVGDPLLARPLAVSYYYCTSTLMSAVGKEALGTCPGTEKLKDIVTSGGFDLETKGIVTEFNRTIVIACKK